MRGPEQKFWASLRRPMMKVGGLRVKRVENKVSKDMPDVAFSVRVDSVYGTHGHNGWIELKACRSFDGKGQADLRHFTGGQRLFLKEWGEMSGTCWLFVKVSVFIFAIPHNRGYALPAKPTFDQLKAASFMHWGAVPSPEDIKFVLGRQIL